MKSFSNLFYHSFSIRIKAKKSTTLSIPMYELRNNFLFASTKIKLSEEMTLSEKLHQFNLDNEHPLYKELKDGFPPGFIFTAYPLQQPFSFIRDNILICPTDGTLKLKLILIGKTIQYFRSFIEAIKLMCETGFGHPVTQFDLLDIYENYPNGKARFVLNKQQELFDPALSVGYSLFNDLKYNQSQLSFVFETPTLLFRRNKMNAHKEQPGVNEQNNGFFSFYHIMKSIVERAIKLSVLYCGVRVEDYLLEKEEISGFLQQACTLQLISCNIEKVLLPPVLQKNRKDRIELEGYKGIITFSGLFNCYVPLLNYFEELHIGKDISYGLGKYTIC